MNKEVANKPPLSLCYCSFAASVPAILPEYTVRHKFSPAEKCTASRTCTHVNAGIETIDKELDFILRYHSFGCLGYTIEWLQDDHNVTAEELAAFEYRIMPEIIKQAFSFKA